MPLRTLQAEDRPQQHRLAGARTADDAEYFVLHHDHVEVVVHDLRAEAIDDAERLDHRLAIWRCPDEAVRALGHQRSSSMNSTANSASARITRKIDCTTAIVVSLPSSRDESRTCIPR